MTSADGVVIWVFGDSGEGTMLEARAYAALLERALTGLPITGGPRSTRLVDRLSSRTNVFARVVRWGVVEPRVVVLERGTTLAGRFTTYVDLAFLKTLLLDTTAVRAYPALRGVRPCR